MGTTYGGNIAHVSLNDQIGDFQEKPTLKQNLDFCAMSFEFPWQPSPTIPSKNAEIVGPIPFLIGKINPFDERKDETLLIQVPTGSIFLPFLWG